MTNIVYKNACLANNVEGISTKGSKKRLTERLSNCVREEKEEELAYLALLEARTRQEAEHEAGGRLVGIVVLVPLIAVTLLCSLVVISLGVWCALETRLILPNFL